MKRISQSFGLFLLGAALATSAASVACTVHGEARVRYYDRDHEDWHHWNNHEEDRYREYLNHHREQYRDFRSLNDDEKKRYWNWRHNQNDGGS